MDTVSGIGVLDKTVAVLDAVVARPASLADLVDRTGISRATAHRLAQGLVAHGLLRRTADGSFALGLHLIGLGRAAADAYPLASAAMSALETLQAETGESAQLYVVDGDDRLCVASVDSMEELRTIVRVGARLPLAVGSAGRVLSGEMGPSGWLESVAERAPGVASVSAPIVDSDTIVAAISVSGPIERVTKRPGVRLGPAVVAAAASVRAALSSRGVAT